MGTAIWNQLELKPPPTATCKLTSSQVLFSDLRKFSDVFWDALSVLQNQTELHTEAATLSRLIYRMKNLFRNDKGFKCIEKVNHCLRHFLSLNLAPTFDNFFQAIPWNSSDKEIYCPSRQMLEHVLVRTQGLAALLCRVVHTCLEAAHFLKFRMSSGHNWGVTLLCYSIIGRIWAIAKHILACCIRWYGVMLPFLSILKHFGPAWLPETYTFPTDLTKWLAVPWIEDSEPLKEGEDENVRIRSSIYLGVEESTQQTSSTSHIKKRIQSLQDDLGVSISRSPFKPTPGRSCETSGKVQLMHGDEGDKVSRSSLKPVSGCTSKKETVSFRKYNLQSDWNESKYFQEPREDKEGPKSPEAHPTPILHENDVQKMTLEKSSERKRKVRRKEKSTNLNTDKVVADTNMKREDVKSPSLGKRSKDCYDRMDSETGHASHVAVQETNHTASKKRKVLTAENVNQVLSLITCHNDVTTLLKSESQKRAITCSLNGEQWSLLQSTVTKLNTKLQKSQDEFKKKQILDKIKKAFKIALLYKK